MIQKFRMAKGVIPLAHLALISCTYDFLIPKDAGQTVINKGDSIQRFRVLNGERKIMRRSSTMYSWFSNGIINSSEGDYSGKPLDGAYEMFGPDSKLLEKGRFRKGQKVGRWIKWRVNGRVLSKSNFRKGWLNGKSLRFNEEGGVDLKNQFSKGKKNGIEKEFRQAEMVAKRKYRIGQLKWEKTFSLSK